MRDDRYRALETPCVLIDAARVRANVRAMQAMADAAGVALRPHIKTHKMVAFARLQVECGAQGITCAKISEAEVMADGGLRDIFVAYPLVGDFRLRRALALHRRVDRLILAVDSLAGATALDAYARENGVAFEVRLEVDAGLHRTGAPYGEAVALAARVAAMPGLRLTGIYAFRGLLNQRDGAPSAEESGNQEGALLARLAVRMREAGLDMRDVSGGSTPTARSLAATGCVSEIRPGTYIFGDRSGVCQGAMGPEDIAARIVATVVSVHDGYAVIDAGCKAIPTDIALRQPPYHFAGYAGDPAYPDLILDRLNEEHGMLRGEGASQLTVGQRLALVPNHICPAINLYNEVYVDTGEDIERRRVDARGMLV